MAKTRCTCGQIVMWKADEPVSDEWFVVAKPDLPDDLNDLWLERLDVWTSAAFCSNCGRLWIAWAEFDELAEYVPVDPTVRPVRRARRPKHKDR
jgi:hypothetical protein